MEQNQSIAYTTTTHEQSRERAKALKVLAYAKALEAEEERNYEVRYIRDPEDPSVLKRTRIREYTEREKKALKKNPKPKLR